MCAVKKVMVGGMVVDALSCKEWADRIVAFCKKDVKPRPFVQFSVNGQVLVACATDARMRALHEAADGLDVDGQPLVIASRLLSKTPLPERVATTDFFHDAAIAAQESGLSFYFLGSTPENIEIAMQAIRRLYPRLKIAGYRDGYVKSEDEEKVVKDIVASGADVLWVGMGFPKQTDFTMRHRDALTGVKWIKTCGGLFDYFNPKIKRAPRWMQRCGLEWLFRMAQEPNKYARRYLTTNGLAAWLLLTRTREWGKRPGETV